MMLTLNKCYQMKDLNKYSNWEYVTNANFLVHSWKLQKSKYTYCNGCASAILQNTAEFIPQKDR